ncbi:MAG: prolyl oligopeptidase family serine peptidase [Bacteroidales bacterium]|nr:prolyl oligopeptidase family serine peptidase [Bacteroidales bacterium]MCF8403087.1 prolyl oligopeptidase family serine peptidase [Bacteroidales bacterium]
MKESVIIILFFLCSGALKAQQVDTFYLPYPISYKDTIIYKRIIEFDDKDSIYHVRDYYPNDQIQMEGTYSSFDKHIKEKSLWCNYRTNTKEGAFKTWYKNGEPESIANYSNGLRHGLHEYWYANGQKESIQNYSNGQKHGECTWWNEDGSIQNKLVFDRGLNQNQKDTNYHYISYTPEAYYDDTLKKWPLIIYMHGGSSRGTDTMKLYCCGIPDQIWRGREFPFVIVAPQCPVNQRWSTDNWFENFYEEITTKYIIDTNKIYLTGMSLGGSGTWYLAIKYPEKFAAIAPMSGFTRHMDYIMKNTDKLVDIPIWAFHGKLDKVVEFEDTEWMVDKLKGENKDLIFTAAPDAGHGLYWSVYTEQELYDWFLKYDKRLNINNN